MPRVPTYDEFQATPQAIQTVRAETAATPQMMSIAGEQMQQLGRGMQSGGDAFSKIAMDVQKDINDAATKEADNVASQAVSDVMSRYLSTNGKDAVVGQADTKKAIQDALTKSGEGLQNNMQRQMYSDVAMRRMQSAMGQINLHAAGQAKQWNIGETEARMNNARTNAESNWVGWNQEGSDYNVNRSTMIAETRAYMRERYGAGENDEMTKSAVLAQTTGLAANTVQAMLVANKSRDAKDYFDKAYAAGEIDPAKAKPIQDMIKSASVKDEALTLSMGLKGGYENKIATLDKMFAEGKITADVHDAASGYVDHKFQQQKAAQSEYEKSMLGNATDWFLHNSGKSVLDFQTANPVVYQYMKDHGKLTDLMTIAQHGGKVQNNPQVWAEVMTDPQAIKNMTPTEIYNKYSTKLDEGHLEKLYSMNAALNGSKDEQHLSIMSNSEMVGDSAKKLGILPKSGKPSDSQSTNFNSFQSMVDGRVASFEASELGGKRKASQQELKKILQDVEMDMVYQRGTVWDSQKNLNTMTEAEQHSSYVLHEGQKIDLWKYNDKNGQWIATVPADQRSQISAALRAAGKPVTEANVVDYFMRNKTKSSIRDYYKNH